MGGLIIHSGFPETDPLISKLARVMDEDAVLDRKVQEALLEEVAFNQSHKCNEGGRKQCKYLRGGVQTEERANADSLR